jgi:heat shock protein HslJ
MTQLTAVLYATAAAVVMAATLPSEGRQTRAAQPLPTSSAAARPALTLQELKNASYKGVEAAGGAFTLANGRWEGKPYEPGSASVPSVTFLRDFRLAGDLNGDGAEEAVVLLTAGTGGTGEVWYLAVVGKPGGKVTNIATAPIGDRVQVRDAKIDGRRIVVDLVQAGENDAACCPGDLVVRTWELAGAALKEGAPAKTGRLSIDVLAGTEWVLKAWAWEEAAPAAPEVTLGLDGTRLTGHAGCNGYFAPVKAGGSPGELRVGPAGSTRKMCPEAEMAVEQRFLAQLAGVTRLQFVAGQLALPYTKQDKSFGVMLFDRRGAMTARHMDQPPPQ